jgi:hypothetical protein
LFRNVHDRDYLGFWADQTLNARGVADFLGLKKPDVAKVAGVAPSSVRFDQKIPREVLERLEEIANICALVAQFFEGDVAKTALWFRTRNPLLGDISPRDMIRFGRYAKLRQFVMDALAEDDREEADTMAPAFEFSKAPVVTDELSETGDEEQKVTAA